MTSNNKRPRIAPLHYGDFYSHNKNKSEYAFVFAKIDDPYPWDTQTKRDKDKIRRAKKLANG